MRPTCPKINELLNDRKPLPKNVELFHVYDGKWYDLSDTARKAANRVDGFECVGLVWHTAWKDLWPRLRIKQPRG